jgi:hypothetical protein
MAQQQLIDAEYTIDNLNQQLSQTSLDSNNNPDSPTTDEVIQAIDDYLGDIDNTCGNDEFDDISDDDIALLDQDTEHVDAILPDREPQVASAPSPITVEKHYDVDNDIVALEVLSSNLTASRHSHPDPTGDVSSSDSITPPPSVSPILRNRYEDDDTPNTVLHTLSIRVYGRQFSSYRSDAIFYGCFELPYLNGSLQSRLHLRSIVHQAISHVLDTRPVCQFRESHNFLMDRPEVSYVAYTGQRVNVYPRNHLHCVEYLRTPEPWNHNGVAHVNVSLFIKAKPRQPFYHPRATSVNSNHSASNQSSTNSQGKRRRHN